MANYNLRAKDIMQTEIASAPPEMTVQEAAIRMKREGVRSLIVERSDPEDAYGIVTYSDIVAKGTWPASSPKPASVTRR